MPNQLIISSLGPLTTYYLDPAVTEIMVDSAEHVIIERDGILEDTPIRFEPPETLHILIENMLALAGTSFSAGETIKDIRFPDQQTRALIVLPPTALSGPYIVIRKTILGRMTWELLFKYGSMNQEVYNLLQNAVLMRANILVAGGTGSGKTTILNRLAELIPADERVVIVEATHDFQINHPRAISLEASATGMSMKDLLSAATKMRPDRLVISELISNEALHVLEILNQGHDGAMTTIHSLSTEDSLTRIETLCLMANLGLGLSEVRAMIASAIQLIVYQKFLPDGKRRITEIVELQGLMDDHYILQPLMRYNSINDTMELTGIKPSWG